jgi:hypothetical protein
MYSIKIYKTLYLQDFLDVNPSISFSFAIYTDYCTFHYLIYRFLYWFIMCMDINNEMYSIKIYIYMANENDMDGVTPGKSCKE